MALKKPFQTVSAIENGQMVMQADLSLNGHRLGDSVHYINGILNTNNGNTFLLNGCDKIIIQNHSHILTIKVLYFKLKSQYTPISLNYLGEEEYVDIYEILKYNIIPRLLKIYDSLIQRGLLSLD